MSTKFIIDEILIYFTRTNLVAHAFIWRKLLESHLIGKEFVLLRHAISLKVNYEKAKFLNCVFCDNFSDYERTYM